MAWNSFWKAIRSSVGKPLGELSAPSPVKKGRFEDHPVPKTEKPLRPSLHPSLADARTQLLSELKDPLTQRKEPSPLKKGAFLAPEKQVRESFFKTANEPSFFKVASHNPDLHRLAASGKLLLESPLTMGDKDWASLEAMGWEMTCVQSNNRWLAQALDQFLPVFQGTELAGVGEAIGEILALIEDRALVLTFNSLLHRRDLQLARIPKGSPRTWPSRCVQPLMIRAYSLDTSWIKYCLN